MFGSGFLLIVHIDLILILDCHDATRIEFAVDSYWSVLASERNYIVCCGPRDHLDLWPQFQFQRLDEYWDFINKAVASRDRFQLYESTLSERLSLLVGMATSRASSEGTAPLIL